MPSRDQIGGGSINVRTNSQMEFPNHIPTSSDPLKTSGGITTSSAKRGTSPAS